MASSAEFFYPRISATFKCIQPGVQQFVICGVFTNHQIRPAVVLWVLVVVVHNCSFRKWPTERTFSNQDMLSLVWLRCRVISGMEDGVGFCAPSLAGIHPPALPIVIVFLAMGDANTSV